MRPWAYSVGGPAIAQPTMPPNATLEGCEYDPDSPNLSSCCRVLPVRRPHAVGLRTNCRLCGVCQTKQEVRA
jgi:hypothetical protein